MYTLSHADASTKIVWSWWGLAEQCCSLGNFASHGGILNG